MTLEPYISTAKRTAARPGFSLMEVLLAVFILGIGLIMVATIFPVGADWTRQSAEDSVAQTIAQNAVTIVQNYYANDSLNGNTAGKLSTMTGNNVQALPSFTTIPVSERAYQYGNSTPFPARNPDNCTYYWTALARVQPNQPAATSRRYDLYILVFRKGAPDQIFTPQLNPSSATEVPNVRDTTNNTLQPTLLVDNYNAGVYSASNTPPVANCVPPVGFIGIGETSGTVFRQHVVTDFNNANNTKAAARPELRSGGENVIWAAPADSTTASPLIYVYQTTVSF